MRLFKSNSCRTHCMKRTAGFYYRTFVCNFPKQHNHFLFTCGQRQSFCSASMRSAFSVDKAMATGLPSTCSVYTGHRSVGCVHWTIMLTQKGEEMKGQNWSVCISVPTDCNRRPALQRPFTSHRHHLACPILLVAFEKFVGFNSEEKDDKTGASNAFFF